MKVGWFRVQAPGDAAVTVLVIGGRVVSQQGGRIPAGWPGTPWAAIRSGMERIGWTVEEMPELPQ